MFYFLCYSHKLCRARCVYACAHVLLSPIPIVSAAGTSPPQHWPLGATRKPIILITELAHAAMVKRWCHRDSALTQKCKTRSHLNQGILNNDFITFYIRNELVGCMLNILLFFHLPYHPKDRQAHGYDFSQELKLCKVTLQLLDLCLVRKSQGQ